MGWESLVACTTGNNNTAVGKRSLDALTTGSSCTAVGERALTAATGNDNVGVGYLAGDAITSGGQNVMLGVLTDPSHGSGTGQFVIGYNVVAQGNYTFTVGYGTSDSYLANGGTTWNTISDVRFKKDIADSEVGLSFINNLRPVTYKWKTRGELPSGHKHYKEGSSETYRDDKEHHGFIAQEIKTAIDADSNVKNGFALWNESDDGFQDIGEGALIPVLVKALQEADDKIDALTARVAALES